MFLRFGREPVPVITAEDSPFEIGKANVLRQGKDVSLIAIGALVYESMQAAEELAKEGIEATVINLHTIKPLDTACLEKYASLTGAIVTAEEHQAAGGMGSAVAEHLARTIPTPIEQVAVQDSFGESGQPGELMAKYGLDAAAIVAAAKRVLARKK